MLPTVDEALNELKLAGKMNPGPWVRHSVNTGIAARNIAEKVSWLDPEKAYILGLLHDIGRRVGIVDIPTHVYEGYRYCNEKGWDEAARVCMTHSYLRMQAEFSYDPESAQEKAIKAYIMKIKTCRKTGFEEDLKWKSSSTKWLPVIRKVFGAELSRFIRLKISLTSLGVKDGKWLAVHPLTKVTAPPKA